MDPRFSRCMRDTSKHLAMSKPFMFEMGGVSVSRTFRALLSASTTYFQRAKYQSVRGTLASHAGLLQNGSIRVGV
jgi:hypothetical protein